MLYKFLFSTVLAGVVAPVLSVALLSPAFAQSPAPGTNAAGDNLLLDMSQAFRRGDRRKLTQLLPQAKNHPLEPWAAYWEIKSRLGEASTQELQDFLGRYAGTYQEDRLRNDWLLLLGQRRDWTTFEAEHPQYRMSDDKEVRCYALLLDHLKATVPDPLAADEVRKLWHSQRDADDGCLTAASRMVGSKTLNVQDVWQKARLALEGNRPRAARDAVAIVSPESLAMMGEISDSPAKFLTDKKIALRSTRKELVTLALVRLAGTDQAGAESAAAQIGRASRRERV